jgi:hypothetical protein
MARTYADELDAWVTQRAVTGREKNLVAFHAVRDDVRTALEAGFATKTIWAHMRANARISYGYDTFRFYVNRFIKKPQRAELGALSGVGTQAAKAAAPSTPLHTSSASCEAAVSPASPGPSVAPTVSPPHRRTGMPTFKFNPIPQREDNA